MRTGRGVRIEGLAQGDGHQHLRTQLLVRRMRGKLARPVLRGPGHGNVIRLPDLIRRSVHPFEPFNARSRAAKAAVRRSDGPPAAPESRHTGHFEIGDLRAHSASRISGDLRKISESAVTVLSH